MGIATYPNPAEKPNLCLANFNRDAANFGLTLFNLIKTPHECKNVIISPLSIHVALGLVYMGAAGTTKKEMSKGLRIPSDKHEAARAFHRIICKFKSGSIVRIVTRLYLADYILVSGDVDYYAERMFKSSISQIDFNDPEIAAEKINEWVSMQTRRKIKGVISPDSIGPDTTAIIVNVLYFKSDWKHPFDAKITAEKDFWIDDRRTVKVNLMQGNRNDFLYGKFNDLDCIAVELPFVEKGFSMLLLMPKSKTGLDNLISNLQTKDIALYRDSMKKEDVVVSLPKFRIEFLCRLNGVLKKMGMRAMFDPDKSDFSDLTLERIPMSIDSVIHKTYIDVNEIGVEAAAATVAQMDRRSTPSKYFDVNRPFLFGIVTSSNKLFFWGAYRHPKHIKCITWS